MRQERNCRKLLAIDRGMVNVDKDRWTRRRSASSNSISSAIAAIACSSSAFQRYTTLARVFRCSVVSDCTLSAAAYACSTHCFAEPAVTLRIFIFTEQQWMDLNFSGKKITECKSRNPTLMDSGVEFQMRLADYWWTTYWESRTLSSDCRKTLKLCARHSLGPWRVMEYRSTTGLKPVIPPSREQVTLPVAHGPRGPIVRSGFGGYSSSG